MNKLFATLSLSLLSFCAFSQIQPYYLGETENGFTVRIDITDIQYHHYPEGVSVFVKDGTRLQQEGMPDLPSYTVAAIVDDSKQMMITDIRAGYDVISNVDVVPSKGNLLRTVDPASIPFNYGSVYSTDAAFPAQVARLGSPFIEGQFRGQSIHFFPVQYNPITRELFKYNFIEVEVSSTEITGENPLPSLSVIATNLGMREAYQSRFINYSAHGNRYEQVAELGDMLIISDAEYFEELSPFITWKKEKGIDVELVDVATIGGVTQIDTYVANYYNEVGMTYLLLVGDEDQVPTHLVNNSGGQGYCDACYGYITGNDHYSEVFIGRLLVHNENELVPLIDKILEYEKNPYMATDWFSVALGIGSNEGNGIGDDNESDWQHNNNIKSDLIGFTYTQVYERYDGNHTSASPTGGDTADGSGNPSAASLAEVINSGCSLINYTGHGDHSIIVTGSFTNTNINALTNYHKYPYWIIVGCCVGDFDDDSGNGDTFGEAWIKSPSAENLSGGIGGSFSSVFQSWAPPMEGQDEMNKLIADIGDYPTRHTIGSIHYHGCASMNDAYGTEGTDMTDTWIVMGDPTVQLRTAYPSTIEAQHVSEAFFGVNTLTVNSASENAMVCVTFNGEILATGLIESGMCVLSFSPVTEPGSLLVTLTNFNTIPYQGYVELVPAEGPYLVEVEHPIQDVLGNNNGQADYSENVNMDLVAENIGVENATLVTAVLATADANVTINDNTELISILSVGETISIANAFAFTVADQIEDQHVVMFTITFTDEFGNEWMSYAPVTLNAPVFNCPSHYSITDGNNNRLESGETATIAIPITNTGHAATEVSALATLLEDAMFASIFSNTAELGTIEPGETVMAEYTVTIASDAPNASVLMLNFFLSTDFYGVECAFNEPINLIIEDWETGDDSQFAWTYEGDADWFTTTTDPFEGVYCMQSGDIGNNESTTLKIVLSLSEPGEVGFSYKTSTEASYDFLLFKDNGLIVDAWSGNVPWTTFTHSMSAGNHTLRWIYDKDEIFTTGSDAAWVDNIILPVDAAVSVIEMSGNGQTLSVYPNPSEGVFNLNYSLNEASNVQVELFDYSGKQIRVWEKSNQNAGDHSLILNEKLASGMYYLIVHSDHGSMTQKVIVK